MENAEPTMPSSAVYAAPANGLHPFWPSEVLKQKSPLSTPARSRERAPCSKSWALKLEPCCNTSHRKQAKIPPWAPRPLQPLLLFSAFPYHKPSKQSCLYLHLHFLTSQYGFDPHRLSGHPYHSPELDLVQILPSSSNISRPSLQPSCLCTSLPLDGLTQNQGFTYI